MKEERKGEGERAFSNLYGSVDGVPIQPVERGRSFDWRRMISFRKQRTKGY